MSPVGWPAVVCLPSVPREFYRVAAELRSGHHIGRAAPADAGALPPGTVVVACGAAARRPWQQQYQATILLQTDSCLTLRLESRRAP